MVVQNPQHTYRKDGVFYYCRRVPKDLLIRYDEERIVMSLRTKSIMEGDICSQVMQKCMDLDIPVLTIHDSFTCPEQHKETVSKLVHEAFTDIVGVSCVVE